MKKPPATMSDISTEASTVMRLRAQGRITQDEAERALQALSVRYQTFWDRLLEAL